MSAFSFDTNSALCPDGVDCFDVFLEMDHWVLGFIFCRLFFGFPKKIELAWKPFSWAGNITGIFGGNYYWLGRR